MTIQEQIDQVESPVARELLQGLHDAFAEAIVIPNHLLPEEYRQIKEFDVGSVGSPDGKVYGRTAAQVLKLHEAMYGEKEREQKHADEKARRVEKYASQMEENGHFEYDPWVHDAKSSARPGTLEL